MASVAAMSLLIVLLINNAPVPVPMWTFAEQQAIDVAVSDPAIQALLEGEGIVYGVVPINGDENAGKYEVGFLNYGSYYSLGTSDAEYEALRGALSDEGPSTIVSENYADGDLWCIVTQNGDEIPVMLDSTHSVVVDVKNSLILDYTSNLASERDCLSSDEVQDAALIANSDSRIGAEADVESVTLLNAYNLEQEELTDEMVVWVRLNLGGELYFAQVDLDERKVVKLVTGGEE
jgi:hypothetical protein